MAPSTPFQPSYTALQSLQQKVYDSTTTTITLPIRPENLTTDLHPYLDNAIVALSTSTAYLYDDNAPWAVRVIEVKKGVERVDAKLDDAKTTLEGQIDDVKTTLEGQIDDVKIQVDELQAGVNNNIALQRNSLRKWLDDPISPISAPIRVGDSLRYIVAKGFPSRVKDFWRLILDPTTLTELARHYSVRDWDRWKRATLKDTDVTCYMDLEDAVAAHPHKCLRALAITWGLQYSVLKRLERPL